MAPLKPLVSDDGSFVSRRIFRDPVLYQLEQQHIFARSWQYVAHESQQRKPGDFLANYMGETPIIVARRQESSAIASKVSRLPKGLYCSTGV